MVASHNVDCERKEMSIAQRTKKVVHVLESTNEDRTWDDTNHLFLITAIIAAQMASTICVLIAIIGVVFRAITIFGIPDPEMHACDCREGRDGD